MEKAKAKRGRPRKLATQPATAKRKPGRPRKLATVARARTKRRKPVQMDLPPELLPQPEPEPQPEPQPEPRASENPFTAGLGRIFTTTQTPESPQNESAATSKISSDSETQGEEAKAQILAGVPDVIGEGAAGAGEAGAAGDSLTALLDVVVFTEGQVKDTLGEGFEWIGERFQSDHWKLSERQLRMLGAPTAEMCNSIWAKLKTRLPDIVTGWCESTPGATAFVLAAGIVIVPKVVQQVGISRARKAAIPARVGPGPGARVSPLPAVTGGVPTATGIIGVL